MNGHESMKYDPLDETLEDLKDIKVSIDANGSLTLSGVDYNMFRSIITCAALYRYNADAKKFPIYVDPESKVKDLEIRNAEEDQKYCFVMTDVIDQIESELNVAISPKYGQRKSINVNRWFRTHRPQLAYTHEKQPEDAELQKMKRMRSLVREMENLAVKVGRILDGGEE
jgi:hypothetical protein